MPHERHHRAVPLLPPRAADPKNGRLYGSRAAQSCRGHLRQQLRRLSEGLRAKCVADDLIRSEVSAYEGAIPAHLWRLLLSEGGVA